MDLSKTQLIESVFAGGGEMGALMRALDWSTTALGPVEQWPQSLRMCMRIVLGSGYPMAILWGPDYAFLYNAAFRPVPGQKHPWALGRICREVFSETWDFIGPMFDRVMTQGQHSGTLADQLFLLERNNYLEECTMEISPNGELAAVLWTRNLINGSIVIYDLMTGARVIGWDIPQGWVSFTNNLAWAPNGSLLLVPVPNAMPCMSTGNEPHLFAFDVRTGTTTQKFNTGLLTGSIAITSDGRILAVDRNCLGVFKNHDPKLRVFDLLTGKIVQEISGRGAGVRYSVSISADGSRFLAFTGELKAGFDWLDAVPYDVRVDSTFSVWNVHNYQGIVTSQNIPGLNAWGLRLSPKGGYVISIGKASFIYELP